MKESGIMERAGGITQDLESMLRLCALLQSVRELYAARDSATVRAIFEQHLTTLILGLVPASRGEFVLQNCAALDTAGQNILERARREHAGLIVPEETLGTLLVPLLVRNEVAGAIYLESDEQKPSLGANDRLLLGAIAQLASLALENAFHLEWLESEVKRLEADLNISQELIGDSHKMADLREKILRIAPTDATVLIGGESGTGKELVARALHQNSPRAKKPFVAINCAALTETLLESELFGHEKGAFTGAATQKRGRLESAEGGTVFLDEVGEMPSSLQAKLLRVLQQREFERVGGTRTIRLDIRLIAATNRNLENSVREGTFREDLFYRLNVISVRTPPLRERREDILTLAHRFATRFAERSSRRVAGISPEARGMLRSYDWPGNVRELENAIERAIVLGSSEMIVAEDLPEALHAASPELSAGGAGMLQEAIVQAKRAVVQRAFEQADQDHLLAAKLLGVHPNYLYRLMRNLETEEKVRGAHGNSAL